MYRAYFHLTERPFALTPDPRFLFLSERHREAFAHLLYGVESAGGFVQLTGEVGTGKTILCRSLLAQTPENVDVALIVNPRQSPTELVASVCDELGVSYPAGTESLKILIDFLNRHLLESYARGRRTVVVIDEAQRLGPEALEQVRLLTNLETATEKLLQIILIGQPELRTLMARPELRQVSQRITARYHLVPLSALETSAYIRHRLRVAGCETDLFTASARRGIYRHSGGVPRLINVICDRALLGAYARRKSRVDGATVRRAAAEVMGSEGAGTAPRRIAWVLAAVAVLAAAAYATRLPWRHLTPWSSAGLQGDRTEARDPARGEAASVIDRRSENGGPATAPRTAPAPRSTPALADLIRSSGNQVGPKMALANLFRRWGLSYRGLPGIGVRAKAQGAGFLSLGGIGDWDTLRSFNLPAILKLEDRDRRQNVDVLAVALEGDTVVLQVGSREVAFARSEVDSLWRGQYFLITRRPPVHGWFLHEGSTGPDVLWLRGQLDRLDGTGAGEPAAGEATFDTALAQRVLKFQKMRGIRADGYVGRETLACLSAAAPHPTAPILLRPHR